MKLKKLIKKSLITEESSAAVGVHYGRGGRRGGEVDDIFAGGYVATDSIKGDLTQQLSNRKKQRKKMEDTIGKDNIGIENPLGGYFDINTDALIKTYELIDIVAQGRKDFSKEATPENDYAWRSIDTDLKFDEIEINNKKDFINQSETNMEKVGVDIKYDNTPIYDKKDFINQSETNMENVGVDIKYDDEKPLYNDSDYINDSSTNWKIINRK